MLRSDRPPKSPDGRRTGTTVRLRTRNGCEIERKDPRLPRAVVIPTSVLVAWGLKGTTVTEATVNGIEIGRRTLKPWAAKASDTRRRRAERALGVRRR